MQLEPTKLATPSMSNGTMRHHNTIENIIIVRRGREQRLSRVRWRFQPALLLTKRVLARVAHVEEVVLVPDHAQKQISISAHAMHSLAADGGVCLLVLLIYRAHQCRGWRQGFVHKNENGLLRCELDALANHVDKLTDSQILRSEGQRGKKKDISG